MDSTRLEILSEGVWRPLKLKNPKAIKYNKLVNRIGNIKDRQISHTNTFELPLVTQNFKALGINIFNHFDLANALNKKYECVYYVEEKIIQKGFLVINNTGGKSIKVNFIDPSLSIIGKWNTITLRELITDPTLDIPLDYKTNIEELRSYFLDKTSPVVNYTTEVGSRGYKLCLFPNNLNTIGDNFQSTQSGERLNNAFNPYQSRPVFNAKSIFDLACETYGYTPIFDPSVDWDKISKMFISAKNLKSSSEDNTSQINYDEVDVTAIANTVTYRCDFNPFNSYQRTLSVITDGTSNRSIKPNQIANWNHFGNNLISEAYFDTKCVFIPDLENSPYGKVKYKVRGIEFGGTDPSHGFSYAVWSNVNPNNDVVFRNLPIENEVKDDGNVSWEIDKQELQIVPNNGLEFIGIVSTLEEYVPTANVTEVPQPFPDPPILVVESSADTSTISETFLNISTVSFNENGEYNPETIDLTSMCTNKKLSDLIKGLMHKEGILIDINEKDKEIKFFNYNLYSTNRDSGNFYDWSKYLRKYTPFVYNTDYGKNYAKVNRIGLNEPYSGNTYDIIINTQIENSKYKEFIESNVDEFNDIISAKSISNSITPYFEFECEDTSLVSYVSDLGDLTQINFQETNIGTISNLPALANVNFANLSKGIESWYRLIDESVRANPTFLLPVDVVKNVDLSFPIYIEDMNGFWIIEEISEYTNSKKPVVVKLIRSIDSAEFNADYNKAFRT